MPASGHAFGGVADGRANRVQIQQKTGDVRAFQNRQLQLALLHDLHALRKALVRSHRPEQPVGWISVERITGESDVGKRDVRLQSLPINPLLPH